MSTEKSLKHLKSKDEFLIANVSNFFEKHSGRDSSSYIQHTVQATGVSRRTVFRVEKNFEKPVHFRRIKVRNGDNTKIVSEYDQEIPQSQTAEYPVAPREIAAQPSRDGRKTN